MCFQDMPHSFIICGNTACVAMTNETEVLEGNITVEECEANARLIASAPRLLEELQNMIFAFSTDEPKSEIQQKALDYANATIMSLTLK